MHKRVILLPLISNLYLSYYNRVKCTAFIPTNILQLVVKITAGCLLFYRNTKLVSPCVTLKTHFFFIYIYIFKYNTKLFKTNTKCRNILDSYALQELTDQDNIGYLSHKINRITF